MSKDNASTKAKLEDLRRQLESDAIADSEKTSKDEEKIPQQDSDQSGLQQDLSAVVSDSLVERSVGPDSQETEASQFLEEQDEESVPRKKGRPVLKTLIFGLFIFLVLGTLVYLALKLKPSSGGNVGKKGEIIWWGLHLDENVLRSLIEDYERENDVAITYIRQSTKEYRERLANALAKGEGPDIFEIHNTWPIMFAGDTFPLPETVMSIQEYQETFYPVIVSDMSSSNGIVGMPYEYDAITLYINEDIFTSAIATPPTTWDELKSLVDPTRPRSLAIKDQKGNPIQHGIALGMTGNVDHWQEVLALMMIQNRVDLANPAGEQAERALDFYLLFGKDTTWNQSLPESTTAFSRGNVAMYFGTTRRAIEISRLNPGLKFRTIPVPQLPKGSPDDPDITYVNYWAHSVWNRSVNREESWKLLKYLSEKDKLDELNKNIEDTYGFKRLSPRIDSAIYETEDPVLGSIVSLTMNAKSWYLVDETYDGETGINSQVSKVFDEAIAEAITRNKTQGLIGKVAPELQSVLSEYGVSTR